VWYLEHIVKEEALFLQLLMTEFLGVSWLERVDHLLYVQNTFVEDMFPLRSYWYSSHCCVLKITTIYKQSYVTSGLIRR
jgi:hypothetical protein